MTAVVARAKSPPRSVAADSDPSLPSLAHPVEQDVADRSGLLAADTEAAHRCIPHHLAGANGAHLAQADPPPSILNRAVHRGAGWPRKMRRQEFPEVEFSKQVASTSSPKPGSCSAPRDRHRQRLVEESHRYVDQARRRLPVDFSEGKGRTFESYRVGHPSPPDLSRARQPGA